MPSNQPSIRWTHESGDFYWDLSSWLHHQHPLLDSKGCLCGTYPCSSYLVLLFLFIDALRLIASCSIDFCMVFLTLPPIQTGNKYGNLWKKYGLIKVLVEFMSPRNYLEGRTWWMKRSRKAASTRGGTACERLSFVRPMANKATTNFLTDRVFTFDRNVSRFSPLSLNTQKYEPEWFHRFSKNNS